MSLARTGLIVLFFSSCSVADLPSLPFGSEAGCNKGPMRQFGQYLGDWQKGAPGISRINAVQNASGEIVMNYVSPLPDPPRRITFYPIEDDRWHWKLEFSFGGGDNWTEVYRIIASRFSR